MKMSKIQKPWTEKEDAFLTEHVGALTLSELSNELNRTIHSINGRIGRLGLRNTEGNRLRSYWTPEEDDYLRKHHNRHGQTEIARVLGRTKNSVKSRIRVLALDRPTQARRWTLDEDDFLLHHYGVKPFAYIARKLNRSEDAIESRLVRLQAGGAVEHTGYLEISQMAAALGVDYKTVYEWSRKQGMPIKKAYSKKRQFLLIDIELFWQWAKDNKQFINFSKIEEGVLLPEPEWVGQQRKEDYHNIPSRTNENWDDEQDAILWRMYYGEGMTQKEIGLALKRSRSSVQKRLGRIREMKMAN